MAFPKLVILALVFFVVWSFSRWLNRVGRDLPRHRTTRRAIEAENLTACRVCGAYVVDGAGRCDRRDCPHPR
jgi:hypothetical protein